MSAALDLDLDDLVYAEEQNLLARYFIDPPGKGGMSPYQRAILEAKPAQDDFTLPGISTTVGPGAHWRPDYGLVPANDNGYALHRLGRAANGIGKTWHANAEAIAWALGWHPTHPLPTPCTILYIIADMSGSYADDVAKVFRELMPPGVLHYRTRYSPDNGYRVGPRAAIRFANGSQILFRSGTQDRKLLAGVKAHVVIVNEPPLQGHWSEAIRALSVSSGPLLVVFTPVNELGETRDLRWMEEYIEGSRSKGIDPRGGFVQIVGSLCAEVCPHRTPESIEQQINLMELDQMAQRRYAKWRGPAKSRALSNFDGSQVFRFEGWESLPQVGTRWQDLMLGLSGDHGERKGAEYWIHYAYLGSGVDGMVWILGEYASPDKTTVATDVQHIGALLGRRGVSPEHIDRWHGDTNSAGKSALTSVNRQFELAIAAAYPGCQVRIKKARKGPGSVGLSIQVINDALGSTADGRGVRVWISDECPILIQTLQMWQGTNNGPDKDLKHPFDSLAYGTRGILRRRQRAASAAIGV